MSRSSLGVSEIISLFPGVIRYFVSDAKHNHYTLIDSSGAKYYLIITSRVLRFPQSIGINYSGMIVGINRRALYEVVRDGDYALIVWGIKDDKKREITVFSAKVKEVTNYVKMFGRRSETTCRRVRGVMRWFVITHSNNACWWVWLRRKS